MKKVELSEIKNLVEYEKARETMRDAVIALKQHRRVSVGDNLTFLFENRETVLFQIQEMVRTERIVDAAKIQDELDAYNALVPDAGELSATLFIEIPGIATFTTAEARAAVNRFQGLDQGAVFMVVGSQRTPARFEGGHSKEEKMAAVQYLRFPLTSESREALLLGAPSSLVVEHPRYQARAEIGDATRASLSQDLRE